METLFPKNARWDILTALAEKPSSMSELAKKANTSIANVSQNLKLMEAYGFVTLKKEKKGNPGKPSAKYSLKKDFFHLTVVKPGFASDKEIDVRNTHNEIILNILTLDKPEDSYFLQKWFWENEKLLEKCKAVCFLKSSSEKIELLLLTDHLDKFRKDYNNFPIKSIHGKGKKVICWSHNEKEIEEGLEKNDSYYIDLMKKVYPIFDPNNIMMRWRK